MRVVGALMYLAAVAVGMVVAGALAAAVFAYSGAYYMGADRPHWPAVNRLLDLVRNRSIRAHAAGIAAPAGLDDPERIRAGVSHYAEHCALCHGAPGAARGDLAEGLNPRPPDLAAAARSYTPGELFWIVKHGIRMTGMPAWGDHSDEELWATVAFIEKLPGMTGEDYAKLVAASRAEGGHHHGAEQSPQAAPAQPPAAREKEQPVPAPRPAAREHEHPAGQRHRH